MPNKKPKIAMAMSGGVDSSVSARLLKKQGYNVEGFFIKFWKENNCCDDESLKNARAAAKKISIPFHVISAEKIFKKIVVDDFIQEYRNLRTPNPCVVCNKFIKFGWFLEFALKSGFDKIATGHYAEIKKDKQNVFHLYSGKDKTKDQSYFLHRLNQEQLSKIIFPVGKMDKKEVYKIAKAEKILPKNKKESQEICFIRDDHREFLKRNLPKNCFTEGDIVNQKKETVGRHGGLINYTIGQRKGVFQNQVKNENKKPLYVAGFDKKKNKLIVGSEKDIIFSGLVLENIFWTSSSAEKKARENKNLTIKIRYQHKAVACLIELDKNKKIKIFFKILQRAVTPGQSAVLYFGKEVLGGGIIKQGIF